jgi:hypothetical protein
VVGEVQNALEIKNKNEYFQDKHHENKISVPDGP